MKRLAIVPGWLFCLSLASAAPDLDVRCIHRASLYWRYNVQYSNGLPYLAPTHNQDPNFDQHWPASGEQVTFSAEVVNHGNQSVGSFQYRWRIDGVIQGGTQTYNALVAPGQSVTVALAWTWPSNLSDHTVTVEVDPNALISDAYRQNNTYTDNTNALSYSIWVEQGLYDRFNARLNGFGTKSFEDWIRWQFDTMRANFARSIYPIVAPQGILERIRIEEINVVPFDPNHLNNWQDYMNADPHALLNDGRWQFTSGAQTLSDKTADWDNYVNEFATQIDWGLIHELSHQLGVIDEYRMNLPSLQSNHVVTQQGVELNSIHMFHQGGLMGGGYVEDGYDSSYFDSHTAGYLNRNLHYRRGFYGDYLFDMPTNVSCLILDMDGHALPGARVSFYQKHPSTEEIYNTPTFSGVTDSQGMFQLPNRSVQGTTTATGHTLHPNPFGQLSVVGQDGTMLLKVSRGGQEDFRWLEVIQLNEAFWRGDTARTVIPFKVAILQGAQSYLSLLNRDVALGKPSTASSSSSLAHFANDGDRTTPGNAWVPNPPSLGQWWQVDLGVPYIIGQATVYSAAGNRHDWFSAFHLEVSLTGAFLGEQTVIPLESNWDQTRDSGDYEVQRMSGQDTHVTYTFAPVRGRYFRIVSDVFQNWVQLQELELNPVFYGGIVKSPPGGPKWSGGPE